VCVCVWLTLTFQWRTNSARVRNIGEDVNPQKEGRRWNFCAIVFATTTTTTKFPYTRQEGRHAAFLDGTMKISREAKFMQREIPPACSHNSRFVPMFINQGPIDGEEDARPREGSGFCQEQQQQQNEISPLLHAITQDQTEHMYDMLPHATNRKQ
jgi:hypothetical protein